MKFTLHSNKRLLLINKSFLFSTIVCVHLIVCLLHFIWILNEGVEGDEAYAMTIDYYQFVVIWIIRFIAAIVYVDVSVLNTKSNKNSLRSFD